MGTSNMPFLVLIILDTILGNKGYPSEGVAVFGLYSV